MWRAYSWPTATPPPPERAVRQLLVVTGVEDHDRGLGGTAGRVGVEVLVDLAHRSHSRSRSSPSAARVVTSVDRHEFDMGIGMGLQVQPPRRFAVAPAVHGHGDQVRAVLEVADDHAAFVSAAPADRGEAHRTPPVGFGPPQSQPAAAQAVHAAVGRPGQAHEPPRGTRACFVFDVDIVHLRCPTAQRLRGGRPLRRSSRRPAGLTSAEVPGPGSSHPRNRREVVEVQPQDGPGPWEVI